MTSAVLGRVVSSVAVNQITAACLCDIFVTSGDCPSPAVLEV